LHGTAGLAQGMRDQIINQGVELMLYGMGTVVLFLAVLVVATGAMSRLLARYLPEAEPVTTPPPQRTARAAQPDAELVAVITAAVHRHRAKRR
jgi:oxaloacetate decarboxylase gamma subunit